MKILLSLVFALLMISPQANARENSEPAKREQKMVETIVCIRHGEKPEHGLGQLNCKGLNRSLALPKILIGRYGTPQFIFAPNPTAKVDQRGDTFYYYVRPLATIEPTAILCGLPVNTEFGYREIDRLESRIEEPKYQNATVFVAWEHGLLDRFARSIVKDYGGDPKNVPSWKGDDYDSIFVFRITSNNGQKSLSFTIDHEGLNGISDKYPHISQD